MPPRPSAVARIPVLDRRILDLGIVEGDQLDHGRVELVLVAPRRGAAFEIAHIGALVGDDEGALELAGIALVDAEIGRQLHRAAHARRQVDEGAVGEHRRIEGGEEIVGHRHHRTQILLHELGVLADRLRDRHEDHAGLPELLLEGGRDRDGVEHGIDRDPAPRIAHAAVIAHHARQHLLLAQRNAELLVGLEDLGVDLVERLRRHLLLRAPSNNRCPGSRSWGIRPGPSPARAW